MTDSKRNIPHFYLNTTVDMTRAVAYRDRLKNQGSPMSFNALLAKAVAKAVIAEPQFNRAFSQAGFVPRTDICVGLAIETDEGVVIAGICDVDKIDAKGVSEKIDQVVALARNNEFSKLNTSGICVTISNLGMYRVEAFTPIIHPGETAILGVGRIADRPVVVDGAIVARKTMPVVLCVDHRIADGAVAARFLQAFADVLQSLQ